MEGKIIVLLVVLPSGQLLCSRRPKRLRCRRSGRFQERGRETPIAHCRNVRGLRRNFNID